MTNRALFTLVDDVLEGISLTLKIKTKITDHYEKELENYTLSIELSTKTLIETI